MTQAKLSNNQMTTPKLAPRMSMMSSTPAGVPCFEAVGSRRTNLLKDNYTLLAGSAQG